MSTKRRRPVAVDPAQLRAELLSLCESFAADGRLVPSEVEALRAWLRDSAGSGLPQELRNVVSRVNESVSHFAVVTALSSSLPES